MEYLKYGFGIIFSFMFFVIGIMNTAVVVVKVCELFDTITDYVNHSKNKNIWTKTDLKKEFFNIKYKLINLVILPIPIFILFAYFIGFMVVNYGE